MNGKTVEDWLSAERFVYDIIPMLMIMGCLLALCLVFLVLYVRRDKFKMKYPISILLVVLIAILAGIYKTQLPKYEWHKEARYNTTAAIRDREKKVFHYGYQAERPAKVYDKAKIEALGLYESKAIKSEKEITYVGKTKYLYYFKLYNKLYKLSVKSDHLVFTDEVSEPTLVGFEYTLKNEGFSDIGFYPEIGPLYTELKIPKEMEDITYDHTSGSTNEYVF